MAWSHVFSRAAQLSLLQASMAADIAAVVAARDATIVFALVVAFTARFPDLVVAVLI